ncbi:MAG: flagellar filament capping protein FliD, partial [bacterium]
AEVARLFAFSTSTSSATLEYQSSTANTEGGTYDVVATYKANGTLNKSGTNTIAGFAATVEGSNILRGKEGTSVEGLRIWFNSPGTGSAGTATATIRIGNGLSIVASDQVEQLTDSVDGLIKIVKDSYSDQITNLEDQIAAYETRLEQKKQMLTNQFIAMEQAVSQAKNQANWASSALSG